MSEQVNIYDAKTRLSQLVARAEAGEEIIIARRGRPAARLVPYRSPVVMRKAFGRQLRSGVSDNVLVELVLALQEDDRLTTVHERRLYEEEEFP